MDGSVDKGFVVGTGADDSVEAIEIRKEGGILVGGKFKSYDGHISYGLVELKDDGSINTAFDVGTGFDGGVRDIRIMDNNKILVGGTFTTYNNTNAVYFARIHTDGSIDHSFAPEEPPNAPINAVDFNEDGSIIVVGEFEKAGAYTRRHIAKYKSDGRLDPDFESVEGANGIIHDVTIQPDGKIIIAGDFTRINYVERSRIARLNPNGTVDRSFDPGTGFNATVYTIVQDQRQSRMAPNQFGGPGGPITNPDYLKVYAGGHFSKFDQVRRYGLARVKANGMLDTTFMDNAFNQFAGVPRSGAQDQSSFIRDMSLTVDRDLFIAGSFDKVGGGYSNFEKSQQNNITRIKGNQYGYYTVLADGGLGQFIDSGVTVGPGRIGFESEHYYADEFIGTHFIKLKRQDGNLGAAAVLAGMINPSTAAGMASEGTDYEKEIKKIIYPTTWNFLNRGRHFTPPGGSQWCWLPWPMAQSIHHGGWQASDAFSGVNNIGYTQHDLGIRLPDGSFVPQVSGNTYFTDLNEWFVTINDDDLIEGNERIELSLYQPKSMLYLGGANMNVGFALGTRSAFLTTIDNDFNHGILRLTDSEFYIDESKRSITIHLERVKGSNGQVSVELHARDISESEISGSGYAKAMGASLDSDYQPRIIDVTFEPEETFKSVTININNDTFREENEAFIVELKSPKGGAEISGPFANNQAKVIIVDDDYDAGVLTLVKGEYTIDEGEDVLEIPVRRIGGTQGLVEVNYSIERISESEENEYEGFAGTLNWSNKDAGNKIIEFEVPDNNLVDEDQLYRIVISNPVGPQSKTPRLSISTTTITVVNDDRYGQIAFASADYYVTENGGEFVVSVNRTDGLTGEVSVEYEVVDGTAKNGEDFLASAGTLNFGPGQTSATFVVPVLNENEAIDQNETVVLKLTNAQPRIDLVRRAVLGTPNIAVLNIIDDEINNVPPGTIDTSFNQSAATDDFIDAVVIQKDGKFIIGGEFKNVNGLVRSRLARLNPDGEIDGSYNLGTGFEGPVRVIKITEDGKAIIAGYFKSFNGRSRNGIARLNEDGILDETFNPGGGADNPINDLVLQEDGKIIIVGEFSTFNGINRVRIARLLPNGELDKTFNAGIGPDATVNSVDILINGRVVVGGDFKTFNLQMMPGVVVLESNGGLVESFAAHDGFNGSVKKVVAQSDLKLVVGGLFTQYQNEASNRIVRLNPDGSRDDGF